MLGFDEQQQPLQDDQISGAEKLLSISFPKKYRELVAKFGGSHGDVEFDIEFPSPGFETCGMGLLLSLDPCSRVSVWSRMATWEEHALNPKVIPFGEDGGGNYICFDYRHSGEPKIVFHFHELDGDDGIMTVASSFDQFLDKLRLPADEA